MRLREKKGIETKNSGAYAPYICIWMKKQNKTIALHTEIMPKAVLSNQDLNTLCYADFVFKSGQLKIESACVSQ